AVEVVEQQVHHHGQRDGEQDEARVAERRAGAGDRVVDSDGHGGGPRCGVSGGGAHAATPFVSSRNASSKLPVRISMSWLAGKAASIARSARSESVQRRSMRGPVCCTD